VNQLVDVVSKNGNLLLNIPVRGDGSIDELELAIVQDIGRWIKLNGEAIFATRPWKIFGEGPSLAKAKPLTGQGFNEGSARNFTSEDIRFTEKGDVLYATFFGWPESGKVVIKSLASGNDLYAKQIQKVQLLGMDTPLRFTRDEKGLQVVLPEKRMGDIAFVLKVMS
jgi:alpha-L-fucosidase